MHKNKMFYPVLGVLLSISFLFFILAKQGMLTSLSFINTVFGPMQHGVFTGIQHITNTTETQLEQENKTLTAKLVQLKRLEQDNAALRDQFQTSTIRTARLLPAHVTGEPGFVNDMIEYIVIDKGRDDGVKEGMVVIYKDNLIGKIVKTTSGFSQVAVISNTAISFSAKTLQTGVLGVIKGQGGGNILLDNVVLDQTLKKNDIVVTNGDMTSNGSGYPPDLVVGKISSVQKDPSALFQKANIHSLVDITKLSLVFVMIQK